MLKQRTVPDLPLPFVVPVTSRKGNSPNGTGEKKQASGGLWGDGRALEMRTEAAEKCASAHVLSAARLKTGAEGFIFPPRTKIRPGFGNQSGANPQISARNDAINRVAVAPYLSFICLDCPRCPVFSSPAHTRSPGGLGVSSAVFKKRLIPCLVGTPPSDRSRAVRRINNESSSGGNS